MYCMSHTLYVTHITASPYIYNEDESVPGIISNERGFGVRLPQMKTGWFCV